MLPPRIFASLCLLLVAPAMADTTLLCIRGKSFQPGREFLQTRQLALQIDGPPLGDALWPLARHAVREQFWPELQLDEVFVSPFDAELCGHEPRAQLQLGLDQHAINAIQAERHRGPATQPRTRALAQSAYAQAAPAKGLPNVSPAPPPNTQPSGEPQAPARGHQWLRLYFATSRARTAHADPAQAFGATPDPTLSFGSLEVSIPADHRWARLESPSVLRWEFDSNPERHIQLAPRYQALSSAAWQAQLTKQAGGLDKSGVLLFVHGYKNTFAEAAMRAAQLAHDLAFPGPTVLFSWPSDGDALLGYIADEEKARTAWRQMADVLNQLTRLSPGAPVYIIAHSMGNRILTQGLAELLRQRPGADRALRQVVLASPDIGREEFRQRWLHELNSANAPRYTLYATRQDIPLLVSGWLHGEPRLGAGGADIFVQPGLDSIDASAISEWFGLSHSYFGDNQSVMSDLFQIIHHGQAPAKRARLRPSTGRYGQYWEFQP